MADFVVRKVEELKNHPKNDYFFDEIDGEKWEEFLTSVQRNGIYNPLVITPDNVVVSGHQRLRACKATGIKEVKCLVIPFQNDDEVIKAMIEINIRQRGVINSPSVKLGRILTELERIYGTEGQVGTTKEWRSKLTISRNIASRSKKLAGMTEEAQQLVEDEVITAQTACELVSKLSDEEQRRFAELVSGIPGMKLSFGDAIETVTENFPDSEVVQKLNEKLAKAQNEQNETELDLRSKLDAAIQRERSTYELLQMEKKRRKKDAEEFERRMDASEQMFADSDEAANGFKDKIAELESQLAEEQEFSSSAQSSADLNSLCAILKGTIGGLTELSNDPTPLEGYDKDKAIGLVQEMGEVLGRIRHRLGMEGDAA